MKRFMLPVAAVAILSANMMAHDTAKISDGQRPAQRGALAVRGHPAMNPPLWSTRAYDNLWKVWGLAEKPADFAKQVQDRYGLHAAPYENGELPMGLHSVQGVLGKGMVNDCLMCHAGRVAGQTVIGVGNASLDLQSLFNDLFANEFLPYKIPFRFSYARGTVDVVNPVAFLMEFRAPDLSLKRTMKLDYHDNVSSDPPAWWLLKRKKTRNWTGGIDAQSVRVDMVNLLSPLNSAEHIKKHETTFADIHAFVMSVEAPKYPFPVDPALAEKGRALFADTCARCHGTYGSKGEYPNKIVPLKTIGTDPTLALAITGKNIDYLNQSWFAQEKKADGGWHTIRETPGYQAPPLDGIWATAPYFHNASVPTLYHVLSSKARPKIFTRSYRTEKEDYDAVNVGWKIRVLDGPPAGKLPAHERSKIHDTAQPGLSNAGHTFGDELTEEQRRAVIEYLKTL
jgi:mono/diheme cytochrome c family protein